jgi:hypothetical protein
MGWFKPQTDGERTEERKSGTNWWYIAGVAIGAGSG